MKSRKRRRQAEVGPASFASSIALDFVPDAPAPSRKFVDMLSMAAEILADGHRKYGLMAATVSGDDTKVEIGLGCTGCQDLSAAPEHSPPRSPSSKRIH